MKKKNIVLLFVMLCVISACGIRIYTVNQNLDLPVIQVYSKGEVVPFGKDFNDKPEDSADGYTLQVLNSELLELDDFLSKYDTSGKLIHDGSRTHYYVVSVSVANVSNEHGTERGVALDFVGLVGTNYYMMLDYEAFDAINLDMPAPSFALRLGTSKEILIPYEIHQEAHISIENIKNDPPKLQLTEYPNRKMIRLD